ncbi:CLUMA_CG020807, isoform A [Clunio marinus]|uniref:CLUMA_CG020807, isoform A n=1 Tax=Clunio marinus TaxID=568069 RepID=A0A1J1J631_9DIPT|nr:CLUMA_CG020807, isoform A [Clunio marinus]
MDFYPQFSDERQAVTMSEYNLIGKVRLVERKAFVSPKEIILSSLKLESLSRECDKSGDIYPDFNDI